jgi:ribose 5-phosphate isomerase B
MAREHNNANVLTLGQRVVGTGLARMIVEIFLSASFAGDRHQRRVDKIKALEEEFGR